MWGFSQGEILGMREQFVDRLFDAPEALLTHRSSWTRSDYAHAVATGGFPEAVRRSRPEAKRRWQTEYVSRVAERDLADLVRLRRPAILRAVLELAAQRTSDVLNVSTMADELQSGRDGVTTYLHLLERVFLLRRLPVYSRNLGTRVTAHPKVHVTDSGLATALARLDENSVGRHIHFGHLLESFVVAEVAKQIGWSHSICDLSYFRDTNGNEVDLVLERNDGKIVAIEVKAGVSVDQSDAKGLRRLRDVAGDRFIRGVVLYTGTGSFQIEADPQISAHPVSALWAE